jgi:hypothetical protein
MRVKCSRRAITASLRGEAPALSNNTSSGTKPVAPRDGMLISRPCAVRRGGTCRGGAGGGAPVGGTSASAKSQPSGPSMQPNVE